MRRVSGIKFNDGRFLQEFERAAKKQFTPDEFLRITGSYTVHRLGKDSGLILEFKDMAGVAAFLEKARAVGLAGRTFKVVKLVITKPTASYTDPASEVDRWARARIEQFAREGRHEETVLFTADTYRHLREEFEAVHLQLEEYVR